MTDREDIDMLAAEYVLGTLDASERTAVAARRQREPALEAAIRSWEARLSALDTETPEVSPPAILWDRIEREIATAPTAQATEPTLIRDLQRRVAFWRGTAMAAAAMAATLALAIGFRTTLLPSEPRNFVAVFQKDDQQPAFLLSIDLATRELTIRPVTADARNDRTYQLWIVDPVESPTPRSLGLIDAALKEPTRKTLAALQPAVLMRATFGISLEPPGGSPTGRPTGPALHGRLYPATP